MKIPIVIGDRKIGTTDNGYAVVSRVYDKWCRIYNIAKVYHVYSPKEHIVVETGRKRGWQTND